jgi:hypothetical protein
MSTRHVVRAPVWETPTVHAHALPVLVWYAAAALLFFAVPFVGTDRLGLQPDLFYLGYFTVAVLFFAAFVTQHAAELKELWTLRLWQSLTIGALVGATLAVGIFQQTGVAHATGWRYAFEIGWRGVVYGTVDAITLFVFPAAVAYLLMHRDRSTLRRKAGFAGLTLVLSMAVTATYHLGYTEFRDSTIRYPEIGALGLAGPELNARRNRAMLGLIYSDPDGVEPEVLELMAADFAYDAEGMDRRRALLALIGSISLLWANPRRSWRAVREVQAPTLVLGGTHDALIPAKVLRAVMAARPDWEGHVLDDRRHALMLEDPAAYLRIFDTWQGADCSATR